MPGFSHIFISCIYFIKEKVSSFLKIRILNTLNDFTLIDDKLVIFEIPEQTELSKTFATIKIYDKVLSRKLKHRFDELWE